MSDSPYQRVARPYKRVKDLPHVSVLDLGKHYYESSLYRLMRKQFPKQARRSLRFEVRIWEGVPWLAVLRASDDYWNAQPDPIASAPLLDKEKRHENRIVSYATVDPELIAYVLLVV